MVDRNGSAYSKVFFYALSKSVVGFSVFVTVFPLWRRFPKKTWKITNFIRNNRDLDTLSVHVYRRNFGSVGIFNCTLRLHLFCAYPK